MAPERVMLSREKLADAVGDRWSDSELSEALELLTRADGRFPSGVRTLPGDLVRAVQRERLLAAMIGAATELGYNTLTVQNVLDRAGISRPTFYEQFEDKEDCFLAAFDAAAGRMRARIEAAGLDAGATWRDRLRSGIAELLRFVVDEPDAARMRDRRGAGIDSGRTAAAATTCSTTSPAASTLWSGRTLTSPPRQSPPPASSAGSNQCSTHACRKARSRISTRSSPR